MEQISNMQFTAEITWKWETCFQSLFSESLDEVWGVAAEAQKSPPPPS